MTLTVRSNSYSALFSATRVTVNAGGNRNSIDETADRRRPQAQTARRIDRDVREGGGGRLPEADWYTPGAAWCTPGDGGCIQKKVDAEQQKHFELHREKEACEELDGEIKTLEKVADDCQKQFDAIREQLGALQEIGASSNRVVDPKKQKRLELLHRKQETALQVARVLAPFAKIKALVQQSLPEGPIPHVVVTVKRSAPADEKSDENRDAEARQDETGSLGGDRGGDEPADNGAGAGGAKEPHDG
jgi:hypothetical protein